MEKFVLLVIKDISGTFEFNQISDSKHQIILNVPFYTELEGIIF